jgi:hypothetical protein
MLLLERFKLGKEEDSKPIDLLTFWKIVGKLIYLTNIRLNVVYIVGVILCFICDLKQVHLEVAKHTLKYLKIISKFGIYYQEGESNTLKRYTNVDWIGDTKNHKSTLGYIFQLGSGLVTLSSCKQPTIALSSTKVEY